MKVFKATNAEMTCTRGRGLYQYEIGKKMVPETLEKTAKCGGNGLHACEYVIDCLRYYSFGDYNRFFLAEAGGDIADHMEPMYLGGTDTLENLVPACRSCNHYKATFTVDKFREHLQGIPARIRRDDIAYQVGERFGIVGETGKPVKFYFEEGSHEID